MNEVPPACIWHTGITVSNVERTAAFFREVLGLRTSDPFELAEEASSTITGISQAGLRVILVTGDNFTIEILEYATSPSSVMRIPASPDHKGGAHLAFFVEELDSVLARGAEWGRQLLAGIYEPQSGPRQGWRICYTVDDDGILIEFAERPRGV